MNKLRILCALVCVQLAGCATCHDLQYRVAKHFKTHSAWKCSGGTSPCHPAHYKDGWKEGYYSVATGGCGKLPPVPPKRYWKARYQTPGGRDQVATWYRGSQEGVVVAQATCVNTWNPVPTSCNAALPTQPCQECAGVYHEPPTVHAVQDPPAQNPGVAPYVPQAPENVLPQETTEPVPAGNPKAEPAEPTAPQAPEVEQLPASPVAAPKVSNEQIPNRQSLVLEQLPSIVDPEPYQESLYRLPAVSKNFQARQPTPEVAAKKPAAPVTDKQAMQKINDQLEAAFVKYAPIEYRDASVSVTAPSTKIEQSLPVVKPAEVRVAKVETRQIKLESPTTETKKNTFAQALPNPSKTTLKINRPQKARKVVAKKRTTKPFRLETAGLKREVTVAWRSLEAVTRQGQNAWQHAVKAAEEARPVARLESIPAKEEMQAPLANRSQTPVRWHGESNSTFQPTSAGRSKLV
ncbi:MAG: hypothetical protein RID07_03175, partial [Lacipirellulaceae bacterium]